MHTVCELKSFRRAATEAGMTQEEIDELVDTLSNDPTAGDEIQGTGGCRKIRVAGRGKGKSGGYRAVTFYSGEEPPVFLITLFSKGERSDLSKADRNDLAALTQELKAAYRNTTVQAKGNGHDEKSTR
jgi:hypothetical protein